MGTETDFETVWGEGIIIFLFSFGPVTDLWRELISQSKRSVGKRKKDAV